MRALIVGLAAWLAASAGAAGTELVRGFTLTEWDKYRYDAAADLSDVAGKTQAQVIVDRLYELGVRQINLSPRATMNDPWRSELIPMTPPLDRRDEKARYQRLIRYIQSKGMKVGMRPIFFVVDNAGKTPYTEEIAATYSDLLSLAAGVLRGIEKDPSTAVKQTPIALLNLDQLVALLSGNIDSPRTDRSRGENWLLRRTVNLRKRVAALPGHGDPASIAKEAAKCATKAESLSTKKEWWHGNIEPEDPNAWFESYKTYLELYIPLARALKVDEFTIGAELYSMTVGIDDQWDEQPHGFPESWLKLLRYVKERLPHDCRVMYDINFTDDKVDAFGVEQYGGEFLRWKYRLADLANPTDPKANNSWKALVTFWKELDAVGIDMYRSLSTPAQAIPTDYYELIRALQQTSDRYATQIDNALFEIESTPGIGVRKAVILKEVGFRSVTKGFIHPFVYAGQRGELNLEHQGAAYEAIFRSFWAQKWDWFKGIVFWDASVDMSKHGHLDITFSPIGKGPTERALKTYFHD